VLINNNRVLGLAYGFDIGRHLVRQGSAEASGVELIRLVLRELVEKLRGNIEVSSLVLMQHV
jgi:hypothetical protein